ncbi:hypothetical protein [Rhodococcus sp. 1168]|uniref:hypothetical protein n=1 Tax=Rhodococcus sp. 1168 TaxID=2018041 RepID=UPI000A0A8977|nr:hypothetical protein [Rhodococcus sp. 1168]ORI16539.1 hypothetical protein BJI47_07465 [Rhodococcus sp. 1168]
MTGMVCHLAVGPITHGVVRYGEAVYDAARAEGLEHCLIRSSGSEATEVPECVLVHIHVTDRLFGSSPRYALTALQELIAAIGGPVSVTLHDLPQPSDGPSMSDRVAFYRSVLDLVVGVVVSSEHEAQLLHEFVHPDADSLVEIAVVPLMIAGPVRPKRVPPTVARTVGVLGFLYPGKGHIETMRAMQTLPTSVGFTALGMPSPGHEYLVDELYTEAAVSGRECLVTGFVDDDELRQRMWEVTVPVAHHRHLSASGSINTWISAGRRPLVPRTRYIEELNRRSPGVLTMYENVDGALDAALATATENPADTWTHHSVVPSSSPAEVANTYDAILRRWST